MSSGKTNKLTYITGRDPKHFPPIGSRIPFELDGMKLLFQVESYGQGEEIVLPPDIQAQYKLKNNLAYSLELLGHIVIPQGSPTSYLNRILGLKGDERLEE